MPLSFTGNAAGVAGTPLRVTVYDGFDNPIDPSLVAWQLPVGITATPDPTTSPPSFLMNSTIVGTQMDARANGPQNSTGLIRLTFAAPGLKFTSP